MNVLVGVGDLTYGSAIVDFLQNHIWPTNTVFRLLHVCEHVRLDELPVIAYGVDSPSDLAAMRRNDALKLVASIQEMLQDKVSGTIETKVVMGQAKDELIRMAENWPADLLVLGSHGRSGFSRFLLGSVSLSVMPQCPCSLMIVHLPKVTADEKKEQCSEVSAVSN
jgi:nucleotide-binding universal stress UspA family protein